MAHHFVHAPAECTVETALRWAQVLGLGGSVHLARQLVAVQFANPFAAGDFAQTADRAALLQKIRARRDEPPPKAPPVQVSWYESGIGEFDWSEGSAEAGNLRRWTIKELLTREELRCEGTAMHHCVTGYERLCLSGLCSVWSMGVELHGRPRKQVLTIEVRNLMKTIVQARGKVNRLPIAMEWDVVKRWAAQESLFVGQLSP